jgi:polyisoprenyl-phosphate glycosyltransferase
VLDSCPEIEAILQRNHCDRVLFVIPLFNDWDSLGILLESLERSLQKYGISGTALIVDDSSTISAGGLRLHDFQAMQRVHILKLKRNIGHQRAIAIGLAYAEAHYVADVVMVMDSDGEDTPEEAMRLIQYCVEQDNKKVVFARRTQRSESFSFQIFYRCYRSVYRLLTGCDIQVGNFSAIPFELLPRLVAVSEIWNHYAAGILKAKLPHANLATRRGYRYHGRSTMNFVSLVTHGLSAISVHGEVVGVRLLVASCSLIAFALIGLVTIVAIRLLTDLAIPGWTSYLVVALISVILQMFIISLAFVFLVLVGRNNTSFLPDRDYAHFVLSLDEIFCIL